MKVKLEGRLRLSLSARARGCSGIDSAPEIQARLAEIQKAHEKLPVPSYVGRVIGLEAKHA